MKRADFGMSWVSSFLYPALQLAGGGRKGQHECPQGRPCVLFCPPAVPVTWRKISAGVNWNATHPAPPNSRFSPLILSIVAVLLCQNIIVVAFQRMSWNSLCLDLVYLLTAISTWKSSDPGLGCPPKVLHDFWSCYKLPLKSPLQEGRPQMTVGENCWEYNRFGGERAGRGVVGALEMSVELAIRWGGVEIPLYSHCGWSHWEQISRSCWTWQARLCRLLGSQPSFSMKRLWVWTGWRLLSSQLVGLPMDNFHTSVARWHVSNFYVMAAAAAGHIYVFHAGTGKVSLTCN